MLEKNYNRRKRDKDGYIFVSYSHKDKNKMSDIVRYLSRFYDFWTDTRLKAGEEYNDRIANAIQDSSVLIFLSSKNSIHSKYCLQEVLLAVDKGVKVIIVHLDNFALPVGLEMRLGGYHRVQNSTFDLEFIVNSLIDAIQNDDFLTECINCKKKPVHKEKEDSRLSIFFKDVVLSAPCIISFGISIFVFALVILTGTARGISYDCYKNVLVVIGLSSLAFLAARLFDYWEESWSFFLAIGLLSTCLCFTDMYVLEIYFMKAVSLLVSFLCFLHISWAYVKGFRSIVFTVLGSIFFITTIVTFFFNSFIWETISMHSYAIIYILGSFLSVFGRSFEEVKVDAGENNKLSA